MDQIRSDGSDWIRLDQNGSGVAIKYGPITALAFTIKLLLEKNCFYKKIAFTKKLLLQKNCLYKKNDFTKKLL